jgi:hypothetical protein
MRRAKMFSRAVCWSLGVALGYAINWLRGAHHDNGLYIVLWTGMMLAALFVHLDPPTVVKRTEEKSA